MVKDEKARTLTEMQMVKAYEVSIGNEDHWELRQRQWIFHSACPCLITFCWAEYKVGGLINLVEKISKLCNVQALA